MTIDDTLSTAERITANPRREAVSANVLEVEAIASTLLDLWEIARAAEALIACDTLVEAAALAEGITDGLAVLRKPALQEAN